MSKRKGVLLLSFLGCTLPNGETNPNNADAGCHFCNGNDDGWQGRCCKGWQSPNDPMHEGDFKINTCPKAVDAEQDHSPIGSVHGAIIATTCDSAASCAVHTTLEQGQMYSTAKMKVIFIRPIMKDSGTNRTNRTNPPPSPHG